MMDLGRLVFWKCGVPQNLWSAGPIMVRGLALAGCQDLHHADGRTESITPSTIFNKRIPCHQGSGATWICWEIVLFNDYNSVFLFGLFAVPLFAQNM